MCSAPKWTLALTLHILWGGQNMCCFGVGYATSLNRPSLIWKTSGCFVACLVYSKKTKKTIINFISYACVKWSKPCMGKRNCVWIPLLLVHEHMHCRSTLGLVWICPELCCKFMRYSQQGKSSELKTLYKPNTHFSSDETNAQVWTEMPACAHIIPIATFCLQRPWCFTKNI